MARDHPLCRLRSPVFHAFPAHNHFPSCVQTCHPHETSREERPPTKKTAPLPIVFFSNFATRSRFTTWRQPNNVAPPASFAPIPNSGNRFARLEPPRSEPTHRKPRHPTGTHQRAQIHRSDRPCQFQAMISIDIADRKIPVPAP